MAAAARGAVPARFSGAAPAPGRRRRALLFAHELRTLLRVAAPIILSQLGGIAMNVTDTIMVAPLGPAALAAAGLGMSVHVTLLMVCTGVLMGMTPLVSQAFGAGERDECRRLLVQGLWLALIVSVPVTLVSLLGRPIALRMGQDPAVAAAGGAFLQALAPGALALVVFAAFRQYLDGMGLTRVAMAITFLGLVANVFANRALIHGVPGFVEPMGVVGAAVATSFVRWVMLVVMVAYVLRRSDLTPVGRAALRLVPARLKQIAAIGVPIGAQMGAEVGIFSLAAVMMGWLGPVQFAAHQVVINIASATFMVALGASVAGSIRVGQHVGAGNPRGARRAAVGAYLLSVGFMSLCALLFLAAPRWLISLYTTDPGILRYGTGLLFMAALFQVFDGAQVAGLTALRGAADTRVPMVITLLGYWAVGLPVAYYLGFRTSMAHLGIWTGLVVSLAVVSVFLAWRVRRVIWHGTLRRAAAPVPDRMPAAALEGPESLGVPVAGD
ncbi:MAG TPA: MATE family efflux transporter [Longimicrobium sp.]|nr:MATE family efflux transporter [Longimicrobium sp.]